MVGWCSMGTSVMTHVPSWWLCDSQIFHSLCSEAFEQFKYAEAILIANQAESQGLTLPRDGARLRMALGQKWGTNFIQFSGRPTKNLDKFTMVSHLQWFYPILTNFQD